MELPLTHGGLMGTIPKRAKQMGFTIPLHITSYAAIPSSILLRFDLEQCTIYGQTLQILDQWWLMAMICGDPETRHVE